MADFATWLLSFIQTAIIWLINQLIDLLQILSDTLVDFIISIVTLFPEGSSLPIMPSAPYGGVFDTMITCVNWLFPVSYSITCLTFVTASIISYIIIAPLARWAKLLT